jgi:DNA-binding NtrC family response regulator
MMTAYGSVDAAVEAMKRGAHDFVTTAEHRRLEVLIARALCSRATEKEVVELKNRSNESASNG